MKKTDTYRFTEKCLYEYPANSAKLKALLDELELLRTSSDVHGHSYDVGSNVNGSHSEPVSAYVERLESVEHAIRNVKRYVEPVTRLVADLSSAYVLENSKAEECREILYLHYFGKNALQSILNRLNVSKSVFYERRKYLVQKAMKYLGL
ncbi:MAG: hypothetical protein IJS39_02520 [Synergistaceae bacterium]|nr:hypothetical protein [Synergistaceae bacterium]